MFMVLSSWQSHCESSPCSFDKCRTTPSGRRPKTNPDDLGSESACTGCQSLHPPSPFPIVTQPESWYSFYRPTEGRRLSRRSWLVTYRDVLPAHRRSPILVLTGSDVAQLRWSRPTRYHYAKPPLCDQCQPSAKRLVVVYLKCSWHCRRASRSDDNFPLLRRGRSSADCRVVLRRLASGDVTWSSPEVRRRWRLWCDGVGWRSMFWRRRIHSDRQQRAGQLLGYGDTRSQRRQNCSDQQARTAPRHVRSTVCFYASARGELS